MEMAAVFFCGGPVRAANSPDKKADDFRSIYIPKAIRLSLYTTNPTKKYQ